MKLIIGNKTYSSWSLRPWILMKHFKIPFEEILIKLDLPDTTCKIKNYSPSGKVPALVNDGLVIWESLAIMEYLYEMFPEKKLYPEPPELRARARVISSEMHAGFSKMREHLTYHAKKTFPNHDLTPALNDIERIKEIWLEQLQRSSGPFLFGDFSIADAMYAPVVGRFKTYHVPVEGLIKNYCENMMNLSAMQEWYEGAMNEDFIAFHHEVNLQPTLRGELITLRPLKPEDFEDLYKAASDPLIWEQHPFPDRYKPENFRLFFKESLDSKASLVVFDNKTQKIIGCSRYYELSYERNEVVIGYTFLAREYWGGIFNRELKKLMINHALSFVNHAIFHVDKNNPRSQKAIAKIGGIIGGEFEKPRPDGTSRTVYNYKISKALD